MEPTLRNGSIVLASSIPYIFFSPKVGNIVVIKRNGKVLIKRVTKEKSGKFYLSGDNQKDSLDSRKFGWVEKKDIIGKVIFQ